LLSIDDKPVIGTAARYAALMGYTEEQYKDQPVNADLSAPATSSQARRQYQRVKPSLREENARLAPKSPRRSAARSLQSSAAGRDQKPTVEQMTSWLDELERLVGEDRSHDVLSLTAGVACTEQAAAFVKLSDKLRVNAYILRPQDALRAARLTAKSAKRLESYERAAVCPTYDAQTFKIGREHENAHNSVKQAEEAIMAAVSTRITTADAPYLADVLLAMAETKAGRQEFLDAFLGHMLWLLSASPRSFQPRVIARIMWALGWMKVEGGAEGEKLSVFCKDANRRAIAALQTRMVEVLDDFLDEDIGTLALDPTAGAHIGDVELRKVLHRAGRLQVGLMPPSAQFLEAMQRLEAAARTRLWDPYQAQIVPFMREYCERLSAAQPFVAPSLR